MKKNGIILLVGILIGTIIGLSLPLKFFSVPCPPHLFDICRHGFWDWTLRVLEVLGTLLAVGVALFKEDWVAYRFKPNLVLDKEHCDIYARGANGYIVRYDAMLVLSNIGRAKANNLKVSIDSIEYRAFAPEANLQTISSEPYNLIIHGGSNQTCIPTDDEIRIGLLSLSCKHKYLWICVAGFKLSLH